MSVQSSAAVNATNNNIPIQKRKSSANERDRLRDEAVDSLMNDFTRGIEDANERDRDSLRDKAVDFLMDDLTRGTKGANVRDRNGVRDKSVDTRIESHMRCRGIESRNRINDLNWDVKNQGTNARNAHIVSTYAMTTVPAGSPMETPEKSTINISLPRRENASAGTAVNMRVRSSTAVNAANNNTPIRNEDQIKSLNQDIWIVNNLALKPFLIVMTRLSLVEISYFWRNKEISYLISEQKEVEQPAARPQRVLKVSEQKKVAQAAAKTRPVLKVSERNRHVTWSDKVEMSP